MSLGFQKDFAKNNLTPKYIQSDSLVKIDGTIGLIVSEHLDLVIANCTGFHSSKLITQFHADRQGWLEKSVGCNKNKSYGIWENRNP
jgi:hypothetical protein